MGVVHNFVNIWINYLFKPSWNWGTAFIKGLRKKNTYPTLSISYHWAIWTSTLPVRLTSFKQNNKGALCSCSLASPQSNILKTMKINHPNKKLQDQYNSTSSVIECLFHEDNPKMNNLQGSYYDDSHFGIGFIQNRDTWIYTSTHVMHQRNEQVLLVFFINHSKNSNQLQMWSSRAWHFQAELQKTIS